MKTLRWLSVLTALSSAICAERGASACASCHPAQAKPQPLTSMAHALETVAECTILKDNPLLLFKQGKYSYRIERNGEQSIYSVTDGQETLSVPIAWALGLGSAGQTYVIEIQGELYESRVSYFRQTKGLDVTLGASGAQPTTLIEAAGRIMGTTDKLRCFGCHATNAVKGSAVKGRQVTLEEMTPGVQCERCHGPSENHLAGVQSGNHQLAGMKKLGAQTTEQISNFCGQCHRTWAEIASGGAHGIVNVRFQPYGLTSSKCYDTEDKRISCLACHDPHQEVDKKDANYDQKCQACHSKGGNPAAKFCRVAKTGCVTCHMPKLELPGSHYKFTDHEIRIVRANAAAAE